MSQRRWFFAAALALMVGATCGALASVDHGWPGAHQAIFPFQKMRPLHVTFSIAWIFLAYVGALLAIVPRVCGVPWRHPRLAKLAFWLLVAAGAVAAGGYLTGRFSGREYVNFMPAASALIFVAWILFLIGYWRTVLQCPRPWPAYLWMWTCGVTVFLFTFVEAHLYLIPFFRNNLARDLTVQWKSYGSLIGSWNLVIYGLALYLAERVSGDERAGTRPAAYAVFWLSFANLLFGWAHHTYQIPQWMGFKWVSFVMSMTEWSILASILLRRTPTSWPAEIAPERAAAAPFLRAAGFWIGVNLLLALLISVPRLNAVSHGTHVTIAHAMGTTIGINTMLLWAAGFYILGARAKSGMLRLLRVGCGVANASLSIFFASLLVGGAIKGRAMVEEGWSFHAAMEVARPALQVFAISGAALCVSVLVLSGAWLRLLFARVSGVESAVRMPRERRIPMPVYALFAAVLTTAPWWWRVPETPSISGVPSSANVHGRAVYLREACWRCHGREDDAPNLFTNGPVWSEGWHRAHLWDPQGVRYGSRMPAFRHLSEADAVAVADYLMGFQHDRMRQTSASMTADVPVHAGSADAGPELFRRHCAACHGVDGRGDGPLARFFEGEARPRDFTMGRFRRIWADERDIYLALTFGMPGAGMPAFTYLKDSERRALARTVLSFSSMKPSPPTIPDPFPETLTRIARGRVLANEVQCATCHGPDLRGMVAAEGRFDWRDEAERPLVRSTDLTSGVFTTGSDPRSLYRTLFHGRGGSPMPGCGSSIASEEDRWSLVWFVRSLSKS